MTYDTTTARNILAGSTMFVAATSEQGSRAAWAALKATAYGTGRTGRLDVTVTRPGAAPIVVRCCAV